jgi:hypothetical protein
MSDDADGNLFCFRIGEIKNAIIADANAEPVAVFQFLAAMRKRVFFERENCLGDAGLKVRWNPGEFLACVARNFNLPDHARMFSSFKV